MLSHLVQCQRSCHLLFTITFFLINDYWHNDLMKRVISVFIPTFSRYTNRPVRCYLSVAVLSWLGSWFRASNCTARDYVAITPIQLHVHSTLLCFLWDRLKKRALRSSICVVAVFSKCYASFDQIKVGIKMGRCIKENFNLKA